MKKLLSLLVPLSISIAASAQESPMYFAASVGDKISLYSNYLGGSSMYGFGIEPYAMYFKSVRDYRWYVARNADGGANDTMELSDGNLILTTRGTSLDGFMGQSSGGGFFKIMPRLSQGSYTGLTRTGDVGLIFSGGAQNSGGLTIAPWNSVGGGMRMDNAGNVGIGTATSSHKLSVNGTIRAKEVIVETGWADFVFEPSYRLRPLGEVAAHIAERGHLPDVPSGKVVEEQGLSMGEMQRIMMQKIEELTLYTISQEKRLAALEAENAELKQVIRTR